MNYDIPVVEFSFAYMLEGMEYLCDYMTPELIELIDIADY
jgi:hypothetical protein